jgi:Fe-S oxidoreductase
MILDNYYSRFYAPKRKRKKSCAAAWIIGIIAFLSLVPLAVRCDKKKGEWGFASLLLYVACRPSRKEEGKRELTISIPGFTHLKAICCGSGAGCIRKPEEPAGEEELDSLLDEAESDADPKVIITEEQ